METKSIVKAESIGNDLILFRVFNAPRALVFKVWTTKKHLEQWWGPHFIKKSKIEIDLRKGGAYRWTMCGPDGTEYPMKGIFTELLQNEKITYTCNLDEHNKEWHDQLKQNIKNKSASLNCIVTVMFEEQSEKTKVSIITRFESEEVRDSFAKMGMIQGWTESMEKVEVELNKIK